MSSEWGDVACDGSATCPAETHTLGCFRSKAELSAEQGDVETIREALAAESQSVLTREEQFAALDRLAAALETAELERDELVTELAALNPDDPTWKHRAEKAERALAEMREALRTLNVTQMDDHDAALVRAALRPSEKVSDES